jgi:predicted small lipoprotein YifL
MRFIKHTALVLALAAALAACGDKGTTATAPESVPATAVASSTAPSSTTPTTTAPASAGAADADLSGLDQLLGDVDSQLSSADSGMNQSEG